MTRLAAIVFSLVVVGTTPALAQDATEPTPPPPAPAPAFDPNDIATDAPAPAPATAAAAPSVPAQPAVVDVAAPPPSRVRLGATARMVPLGTLSISDGSDSESVDMKPAFGFGAMVEYDVAPTFSVGAAPTLFVGVKGEEGTKSATQLDLVVRGTLRHAIAPKLALYGFGATGYSFIFLPDNDDENPKGFVLGFGAGLHMAIAPRAFVSGEIGYQLGFQGLKIDGDNYDLTTDLLHFGASVGTLL